MNIYIYLQSLILLFVLAFLIINKCNFNGKIISNTFFNYFNIGLMIFLLLFHIYEEPIVIEYYLFVGIEIVVFYILYIHTSKIDLSDSFIVRYIQKKPYWFYFIYQKLYYIFFTIFVSFYALSFIEDIKLKKKLEEVKNLNIEKYEQKRKYQTGYFTEEWLFKNMISDTKGHYYILLKIYTERYAGNKKWPRTQKYYADKIIKLNETASKIFETDEKVIYLNLFYKYLFLNNLSAQQENIMININNKLDKEFLSNINIKEVDSYSFIKISCNNIQTNNIDYIKNNFNNLSNGIKKDKCILLEK